MFYPIYRDGRVANLFGLIIKLLQGHLRSGSVHWQADSRFAVGLRPINHEYWLYNVYLMGSRLLSEVGRCVRNTVISAGDIAFAKLYLFI